MKLEPLKSIINQKIGATVVVLFTFIIGLSLSMSSSIGFAATEVSSSPRLSVYNRCVGALNIPALSFEIYLDQYVFANGVAVTGEFLYPLPLILKNLSITREVLQLYKHGNVLTLGEGFSGLLPLLFYHEVQAQALDLWYHAKNIPSNASGLEMQRYIREYGDHLIQGDATQMPLPSESFEFVVSHMLLNNMPAATQFRVINEVVRILKPGGEARLFPVDPDDKNLLLSLLSLNKNKHLVFSFEAKTIEGEDALLLQIQKPPESLKN